MSIVRNLIISKNFESFDDLKHYFVNEYHLKVQEYKKLYMLRYTESSDLTDSIVRECEGIIFEKNTNNIVHYTHKKCFDSIGTKEDEVIVLDKYNKNNLIMDMYDIENIKDDNDCKYLVQEYIDGSLIKVYNWNNEWIVSTASLINAKNNFWKSNKSFYTLFEETVKNVYDQTFFEFTKTLDKKYAYSFVMQHPENETIISIKEPKLLIINRIDLSTINNKEQTIIEEYSDDLKEISIENINNLIDHAKNDNNLMDNYIITKIIDGVIDCKIKILSEKFLKMKTLYGNYPNIGLKYIEHISNVYNSKYEILSIQLDAIKAKKEFIDTFSIKPITIEIDRLLQKTINQILRLYIDTKIMKKDLVVPKKYEKTIKQLQYNYSVKRNKLKKLSNKKFYIEKSDVEDIIYSLPPKIIAFIICYE